MTITKITTLLPCFLALNSLFAEPLVNSWYTDLSGQYARIYESLSDMNNQNAVSTWSGGAGVQSSPTYAGVNEVSSDDTYVYIRTTALGFHVMGPWYLDINKTVPFGNYPSNQAALYRFPRTPSIPTTKTATTAGAIGYFVDGITMFDSSDTFSYDQSEGEDGGPVAGFSGEGVWNRDAYVNESVTFDNANAHQAGSRHHYHANPPALRHLLGDSVTYTASTNTYTESFNGKHSPIIGWCQDGLPIYGPYGYSSPLDASSTVRRMISGFQKRDGTNGSTNLAVNTGTDAQGRSTGRTTLPQWIVRNNSSYSTTTLATSQYGPATTQVVEFDNFSMVNEEAEIGRYIEDYAYKGDLGLTQYDGTGVFDESTHFDLNEYNVRFCVTPEYPSGTWAYFTNIESDGTPAFPYNITPWFFGTPSGGSVTSIPSINTIHFEGGPEASLDLCIEEIWSADTDVTLTWSGVEGGYHLVERSSDLSNWQDMEVDAQPNDGVSGVSIDSSRVSSDKKHFYRISVSSVDAFDSNGFDSVVSVNGSTGGGSTFIAIFDGQPLPPANAIEGITLGGVTVTDYTYNSTTQITVNTIPSGVPSGSHSLVVTFTPPGMGTVNLSSSNTYTAP